MKVIIAAVFIVLLSSLCTVVTASDAKEDLDLEVKSAMLKTARTAACRSNKLLRMLDVPVESCEALAKNLEEYCWARLEPWLPDMGFGDPNGFAEGDVRKHMTAIFMLQTCMQSKLLLDEDEQIGADGTERAQ